MPTEPHNPLSTSVEHRSSELSLRDENLHLREIIALQESRITCIQEIGVALGSTMSLDDLLNVIMEKITVLMQADRSTLFLVDRDQDALWSKVIQGDQVNEIRLLIGEGIAGWVAKAGQSINIRNAYQDERFNSEVDMRPGYQPRSILCQPIRNHKGDLIGVVQVLNSKNGYFSDADENLLSALASQAAVSIENSMLYLSMVDKNLELTETKIKLEKKIAEVDFLYDIQRLIGQAVDLQDLLQLVASKALDISEAELCAVAIREKEHLRLFSLRHEEEDALRIFHASLDDGVCAMVIDTGAPYMTNSSQDAVLAATGLHADGLQVRHIIAAPFFSDDRCIGAVKLINKRGADGFDDDDMKLLTLLAGQIAGAVAAILSRERQEKANRLATIGQMLSGVIHDFKTPVTIISGYVQLMARQNDPDIRKEYAESVLKQFDQLNKMTREILAFARGESSILLRKVFMRSFAEDLRELLSRELGDRGIDLQMETRYGGAVKMDDVKLKRAIFNLARNAAEAMPDGGTFSVVLDRDGADAVLTFSDTGQGIPVEIRASLFESFVTQGKEGGTGLGLAIVKKIVEEHNGSITFTSEVGEGTTFTIRIPTDPDQDD